MSAIAVFDIDGVVRDVGHSYRRALADTVEHFTQAYRPSQVDIDRLKQEGVWNNDWEASRELIYRHFEAKGTARSALGLSYETLVDFFQRRYRGDDLENPDHWNGYITQEPLLMQPSYLESLTSAGIAWGFFSGATRGSACFVLEKKLGLRSPVLVAMEDAPGKPDPTGLFQVLQQLEASQPIQTSSSAAVIYVGDTVADMQTVERARNQKPDRPWIGVGILPPHAQQSPEYKEAYIAQLQVAGAAIVLDHVEKLTPEQIQALLKPTYGH
ncbi:MAG: TIGR01548 family HAD-type hydrolase [Drouetiella hepatica Uher 2000/2452]|jgi:HAD superfamily phosphatase|uniref:TIGR01548 family HAD-type hydrolase n=1 Tax=Drouetiella hepatica Uher 2000/2452 TaxID=904376 RepID=A0A951QGC0_9CYAN|nr:TIGR01548 family HAD-type hydrolase [Drouetiella hepatica Uher 2000/2452]